MNISGHLSYLGDKLQFVFVRRFALSILRLASFMNNFTFLTSSAMPNINLFNLKHFYVKGILIVKFINISQPHWRDQISKKGNIFKIIFFTITCCCMLMGSKTPSFHSRRGKLLHESYMYVHEATHYNYDIHGPCVGGSGPKAGLI